MAKLVLAVGTSHSPLLASPPEDYPKHAEIDAKGRKLLDRNGRPCTYGELLAVRADRTSRADRNAGARERARQTATPRSGGLPRRSPTPVSIR